MGLFLGKSCQKRPFFHTLDRKECFLEQNSKVLKKVLRIEIFSRVSPWFLLKYRYFIKGVYFAN